MVLTRFDFCSVVNVKVKKFNETRVHMFFACFICTSLVVLMWFIPNTFVKISSKDNNFSDFFHVNSRVINFLPLNMNCQ